MNLRKSLVWSFTDLNNTRAALLKKNAGFSTRESRHAPTPHLPTNPAHLGRAASATVEPDFTGPDWFEAYAARHAADGQEGRLVPQFAFSERWDSWEMHPHGAELVICTQGACTLHQEHADGSTERVTLAPGDYAINPPGTWHTADVAPGATCTAIFITPGIGTTHRPR